MLRGEIAFFEALGQKWQGHIYGHNLRLLLLAQKKKDAEAVTRRTAVVAELERVFDKLSAADRQVIEERVARGVDLLDFH